MRLIGDVKCYHCGHVSGQIEGTRTDKLVLNSFKPRPGYQGPLPENGERIRCERCQGPVFLEDMQPVDEFAQLATIPPPKKRPRSSSDRAA